jgi:hypothetical protein
VPERHLTQFIRQSLKSRSIPAVRFRPRALSMTPPGARRCAG